MRREYVPVILDTAQKAIEPLDAIFVIKKFLINNMTAARSTVMKVAHTTARRGTLSPTGSRFHHFAQCKRYRVGTAGVRKYQVGAVGKH
jgi:hypothetical protein